MIADLTGQRFSRLTVVERDAPRNRATHWICRCDCGEFRSVSQSSLSLRKTKSCGCLSRENTGKRSSARIQHGHNRVKAKSPTWQTWVSMLGRCRNPKARNFHNYGGRGIMVCDRWSVFTNFLADMGERPAGATIDRVDNNGHYEPGNCRWADAYQQHANTRTARMVTVRGDVVCMSEASRRLGISRGRLTLMLKKGEWPFAEAA